MLVLACGALVQASVHAQTERAVGRVFPAAEPASGAIGPNEIVEELKSELSQQREQIAAQQQQISAQQQQIAGLRQAMEQFQNALEVQEKTLSRLTSRSTFETADLSDVKASIQPAVLSTVAGPAEPLSEAEPAAAAQQTASTKATATKTSTDITTDQMPERAPLSFKIGETYFTPLGFMDLTYAARSTNVGSGIGTSFGSIPYNGSPQGQLSENILSTQNSRLGLRFDALVNNTTKVLGYYESDFAGNSPSNVLVTTHIFGYRLHLFYVDLRRNKWEILGGQAWSLITPGRRGISPLPEDLFISRDIDIDYQLGLPWARIPTFRVIHHPTDTVAWAIGAENPQQYIGGSAGGGMITLPSDPSGTLSTQLNNGTTNLSVPNRFPPDILAKIAFDPPWGNGVHFEIGGMARTFRTYYGGQKFTAEGGGVSFNSSVGLLSAGRLRLLENFIYGRGVGRYLFGQGPDLIVNWGGRLGLIPAGGVVAGVESQVTQNLLLYGYYGGDFFGRAVSFNGGELSSNSGYVGYGFPGAPAVNNNNRTIQEGTAGFQPTAGKIFHHQKTLAVFTEKICGSNDIRVIQGGLTPALRLRSVSVNRDYQ